MVYTYFLFSYDSPTSAFGFFFIAAYIFDPGVLSAYIIFGVYFHRVTQVYLEQMAEMVTKEYQERRVNRSAMGSMQAIV